MQVPTITTIALLVGLASSASAQETPTEETPTAEQEPSAEQEPAAEPEPAGTEQEPGAEQATEAHDPAADQETAPDPKPPSETSAPPPIHDGDDTKPDEAAMPADSATTSPTESQTTTNQHGASTTVELENGEILLLDDVEVVEVYADRPNRPFRRDTALRISGPALAKRGATNLAQALDLLPELTVRQAGRGGFQVNVRGARKGAIKVLIDGVPVDEVYYGTFDISSIPVTDIANIRISTSPASPIDGVGGPGGVIEVNTIDAAGGRLLRGRAGATDLPSIDLSTTGRLTPFEGFSIRGSIAASLGMREFKVDDGNELVGVDESRRNISSGLRLEYRRNEDRIVADGFFQHRRFLVPPGEDGVDDLLKIDRELSGRFGIRGDFHRGDWRFQGHSYFQSLDRRSTRYSDPLLSQLQNQEDLTGTRVGGGFLVNRTLGKNAHLLFSTSLDSENADAVSVGQRSGGRATISEIAAGAQYHKGPIRLDGAIGLAAPLQGGGTPWPEAKLSLTTELGKPLTFKVTAARKGRLPTTRERFRSDIGNEELDPEIAHFAEMQLTARPLAFATLTVAGYVRDTSGQIRFDGSRGTLINLNNLKIRGIDASVDIEAQKWLHIGGSYHFSDSFSEEFGSNSLDFFPRHRAEGWTAFHWNKGGARARVRFIDKQIDRDEVIPSRTTIDLSAHHRFGSNWDASVRVDNIVGKRHRLRVGGVRSDGRVISLILQATWR